jgi:hypothetical protein
MNATEREVLEALKECAGLLDQLLNGQDVPSADDVDAALLRARAAIQAATT